MNIQLLYRNTDPEMMSSLLVHVSELLRTEYGLIKESATRVPHSMTMLSLESDREVSAPDDDCEEVIVILASNGSTIPSSVQAVCDAVYASARDFLASKSPDLSHPRIDVRCVSIQVHASSQMRGM